MTNKTCCKIQLLGKSYSIWCPEGEEKKLALAAEKLNTLLTQQKNKFKQLNDFQALLLSALELGHELITCDAQLQGQRKQLTDFISKLENKMHPVPHIEATVN